MGLADAMVVSAVDDAVPVVVVLEPVIGVVALPVVLPVVLPPGVPVVPIGVDWVLCWPAPTAGSLIAAFGGVPCANAEPAMTTAAVQTMLLKPVLILKKSLA